MTQKYNDLQSLLSADGQAREFYSSLPDYVKDHISTRAQNVNTYKSLRDYAENLLRGDD